MTKQQQIKAIKSKLTPQAALVFEHLLRAGSITNVEANAVLRCRSVSRRITEIIDVLSWYYGFSIVKQMKRDSTGQRYIRYFLKNKGADDGLLRERCCGDAACYNESNGVPCAAHRSRWTKEREK